MSQQVRRSVVAVLSGYAALAAAPGSVAYAAESGAADQAQGGLETVIVTARKRTESVQDVPVAVQAITGEEIRRQDLSSLEKVAEVTPDFTVGRASNGSAAQLTLRGIGSSSTSIGIEQSVAVVVDGVYYGQGRIIEEGFFDLAQMELLKGPQALFFGKNATAGVVSLTTADPGRETEFLTKIAYEFKSRTTQGELIGSGMLTDTLGLRVAVRGSVMSGGYYQNVAGPVTYTTADIAQYVPAVGDTPGFFPAAAITTHYAPPAPSDEPAEREFLSRVTLKWTPNDQLTGTLKFSTDYNHTNNSSWNYIAYNCPGKGHTWLATPGYACGPDFVIHQNNIPTDIATNFPYSQDNGALYNRYQSYAVTGTLNWKLDDYNITSVTNYNRNNNSWACACDFESSNTGTWATENSTWWAASEELRVLSTYKSPLNFMLGGLYQKTRRNFAQWIMFAGLSDSSQSPENVNLATTKESYTDGKTAAIFGQLIWQVTPTVEATVGARYTHESKDSEFDQPYNNGFLVGIFRPRDAADGLGIVSAGQTFKNFSPEATVKWKATDNVMVYGAFKTAYKSGGFDNGGINSAALAADPASYMTFNPEKARGFELGVKSTLADNQLRLNVTLFDYKYLDLQVDFFNSSTFAFQTVSADAETKGIEFEAEYAPREVRGLTLHGSVNYDDAKYKKFVGPCYAGETPAQGCSIATTTVYFQDLSGQRLGMAPKLTGTLGGRYEIAVGHNGMHLDVSADARYSDEYLASSFGNPYSKQSSYVNVDAALRLVSGDDKWEMALVGKNLSNKVYVGGVVDGPSSGDPSGPPSTGNTGRPADQMGFGNLPRTVQFQAQVRF